MVTPMEFFDSNENGGFDDTTHSSVHLHQPPLVLVAFRAELLKHADIYSAAEKGGTFEECLGIVAAKLDIVLDGMYDVVPLLTMLTEALKARHLHGSAPHLRVKGLVSAEIVETADGISLQPSGETIAPPKGAILSVSDTSKPGIGISGSLPQVGSSTDGDREECGVAGGDNGQASGDAAQVNQSNAGSRTEISSLDSSSK